MNGRHEEIERLLQQARPVGLSATARDRITTAAAMAWREGPANIPWQIPVRRLAISAIAAVLVISAAGALERCVVPGRQDRQLSTTANRPTLPNDLYPAEYGIVVTGLETTGYRSIPTDGLTLGEYLKQLQEIRMEDGPAEPIGQPSGRSRLAPAGSPTRSWS